MLAAVLFVAGLVLLVVAVAALAGPWWGVLAAGLILTALGVLTAVDERRRRVQTAARDGERS